MEQNPTLYKTFEGRTTLHPDEHDIYDNNTLAYLYMPSYTGYNMNPNMMSKSLMRKHHHFNSAPAMLKFSATQMITVLPTFLFSA